MSGGAGALLGAGRIMWRSPTRYVTPLFIGFEVVALLSRGQQWRGEWAWTIDWIGGILVLLGPVVAGVAAWRTVAARKLWADLGDLAGAGRAARAEVAAVVLWAALCHLGGLAVAIGITASAGASGFPSLWPVVPQIVAIAGYAGLGLLMGSLVPNGLIGPLTTVTLLLTVTQFSSTRLPSLWVYVGGATSSLSGLHYNPRVALAQTAFSLGLGGLGYFIRRPFVGRLQLGIGGLAVSVVALVIAATWLASDPDQYLVSTKQVDRTCVGARPRVCMVPASSTAGEAVQRALGALTAAARAEGVPNLPQTFEQQVGGVRATGTAREFFLNPGAVSGGRMDPAQAAHYFVFDRRCLATDDAPPAQAVARLVTVSEYLALKARLISPSEISDPALVAALRAPERRRRSWVVRSLGASFRCRFDQVPNVPS